MSSFQGTKINPKSFHKSQIKFYVVLVLISIFMGLPIVFIFSQAFKPIDELFIYPPKFLVRNPSLDNFKKLFSLINTSNIPISRYIFNSIVSTLLTVLLTLLITASAGYSLSKKNYKLKKAIFDMNTLALMFVATAVTIPRYLIISKLNIIDNFSAHILPMLAMPVGLFLVKQFMDQIPNELIEAAKIDGASEINIFSRIIVPLSKSALATVAILTFQASWNSVDSSSLYISQENLKTFSFYMSTLTTTGNNVVGQGMAAASTLLMFIPNLIVFIVMQKQVMDTMAHSGIK